MPSPTRRPDDDEEIAPRSLAARLVLRAIDTIAPSDGTEAALLVMKETSIRSPAAHMRSEEHPSANPHDDLPIERPIDEPEPSRLILAPSASPAATEATSAAAPPRIDGGSKLDTDLCARLGCHITTLRLHGGGRGGGSGGGSGGYSTHRLHLRTASPPVREPQVADQSAYDDIQQQAAASPAAFWDPIAKRELHWLHPELHAWLSSTSSRSFAAAAADEEEEAQLDDSAPRWTGWHAATALPVTSSSEWTPWLSTIDATHDPLPFVKWFNGGRTNAAFNEVDRHVLSGSTALGEDQTAFAADGGHGAVETIQIRDLLVSSILAACSLTHDGGHLQHGQRLALYLPNDLRAAIWIEGAKRIGVPFVAVASGTASPSLASRLADTGASLLVTSDSLMASAEEAMRLLDEQQLQRPIGMLLPSTDEYDTEGGGAASTPPPQGWLLASECLERARQRLRSALSVDSVAGGEMSRILGENLAIAMPSDRLVPSLWTLSSPLPVDACFPLFILYTSGSTGKPKGIVHTHGGYQVGLRLTTRVCFDLRSGHDVFLVIATPGWITGQSYMIAAALLARVPSIMLEGSPVSPPDRFASTIQFHGVTVLKAGSTFLRMLMTMPGGKHSIALTAASQGAPSPPNPSSLPHTLQATRSFSSMICRAYASAPSAPSRSTRPSMHSHRRI